MAENQRITKTSKLDKGGKQLDQDLVNELLAKVSRLDNVKEEFLGIFGLFAALLIFTSVEVKVFQDVTRFSLIVGISSFFVATLMLFVLTLNNVIHRRAWSDFWSAASVLSVIFLVISGEAFWWATHFGHILLLIWNVKIVS